jgi:hypothetical protein
MVDFAQKAQSAAIETRKPARTQFLTSAAYSLCPHPIFVALLSPIPKLAFAARRLPIDIRQQETRLSR